RRRLFAVIWGGLYGITQVKGDEEGDGKEYCKDSIMEHLLWGAATGSGASAEDRASVSRCWREDPVRGPLRSKEAPQGCWALTSGRVPGSRLHGLSSLHRKRQYLRKLEARKEAQEL